LSSFGTARRNWIDGNCAANGVDIHYLRTGGRKGPLVLLHGLTASGACRLPLARAFAGEYDVVMPDARGHGTSTAPSDGYRYEDHAGDVVGLIQGLGLAAPVLLGHSMGGMTATVVASRLGTAIRGVILADPTFSSACKSSTRAFGSKRYEARVTGFPTTNLSASRRS
jgi:N-formylmaleamate deformylase